GGLGAGDGEAQQLGARDQPRDQLGPAHLELVAGAEVSAASDLLLHRAHDCRMAVAQEERAVAHPVVDVLVAVDVPLAGAGRALDVGRERSQMADVVGDTAGNRMARALPERGGLRVLGAVLLVDRHRRLSLLTVRLAPMIPERDANRSKSTTPACVSAPRLSTVASRRRVTPSHAPAATQAAMSRRSTSAVCKRSSPV